MTTPDPKRTELVGLLEIADLLGVAKQTPRAWRLRGVLPDPEWIVSDTPVWRRATIEAWAAKRPSLTQRSET